MSYRVKRLGWIVGYYLLGASLIALVTLLAIGGNPYALGVVLAAIALACRLGTVKTLALLANVIGQPFNVDIRVSRPADKDLAETVAKSVWLRSEELKSRDSRAIQADMSRRCRSVSYGMPNEPGHSRELETPL